MSDYNAIVIGCGGGGAVAAKELGERGLSVLVLEAGAKHNPFEDYYLMENTQVNPEDGVLRWGSSDRSRPMWYRDLAQNAFLWQTAGVGGTTQIYLANSPRAYRRTFLDGGDWQQDNDPSRGEPNPFPFGYEELRPYFEKVEATLPVGPAPMTLKEDLFFWGASQAGLSYVGGTRDQSGMGGYREQPNAVLPPDPDLNTKGPTEHFLYPAVKGCVLCGHCINGCRHPNRAPVRELAKRSTNASYAPLAEDTGRVTIRPNSFALRVLTGVSAGEGLVASGVVWRDTLTGAVGEATADVVILSAGAVEDPRLWLNSGLPDPFRQVGIGLTTHHFDWVVGTFERDVNQNSGQSSAARCDFPGMGAIELAGLSPGLFAFGSYEFSRAGYNLKNTPAGSWDTLGRLVGPELKGAMGDYKRSMALLVITDDERVTARDARGRPLNGVSISQDYYPDENGPVPYVSWAVETPGTRARREWLAAKAAGILRAAGAVKVHRADWPPLLLHVHSTMPMGTDPASSVVDAWNEAHLVRRLFVCDNAALPNALGGPNPTLTNQALTTRACERIAATYFAG